MNFDIFFNAFLDGLLDLFLAFLGTVIMLVLHINRRKLNGGFSWKYFWTHNRDHLLRMYVFIIAVLLVVNLVPEAGEILGEFIQVNHALTGRVGAVALGCTAASFFIVGFRRSPTTTQKHAK